MARIQLVIVDEDIDYIEKLILYIRSTENEGQYSITSFTNKQMFMQYLETAPLIDVILIGLEMYDSTMNVKGEPCIILLCETLSLKSGLMHPTILKYQPLPAFLTKMMAVFLESYDPRIAATPCNGRSKVISIYSAGGGCGKTTIALNLAKQLTEEGLKLLYLNFDSISASPVMLAMNGKHAFSEMLYYLRSDPDRLSVKLDMLKQYDPFIKCDYMESVVNPQDMSDFTKQDLELLLETIIKSNAYDVVLIDLEATLHERIQGAFAYSNHILWITLDDIQFRYKTTYVLDQMKSQWKGHKADLEGKIHFIANKSIGMLSDPLELPYIPQWKSVTRKEQLFAAAGFNQRLQQLYQYLHKGMVGVD